jgi:ABC-type amino acid transport substrate-binding protein
MSKALPLALLLAAVLAGSCVPPEREDNLGKRWDTTTVMGELQREGTLRVGVSPDSPASSEDGPGPYGEFTLDFARYLADILGVDLVEVEVPHSQLQTGIDSGDIDIAFPIQAITEEAVRKQAFTDPLFVSHQRLLVPEDTGVTSIEELAGQRVCSAIESATGLDLGEIEEVDVVEEAGPALCAVRLAGGDVSAVTAPDVVLVALQREVVGFAIVGDQLTTQGYGALLTTGANAWADYVGLVITKWEEDGGWLASYQDHFGDALPGEPEPADLTVEEAAALFPEA